MTGLGDACANALGVGAIRPGDALTVLGTSCLNSLVTAGPDRGPAGLGFLFAMPMERYLRILPNTSGTIAFDWFLDRCRTTSNILGDMTVAVLLDKTHDEGN